MGNNTDGFACLIMVLEVLLLEKHIIVNRPELTIIPPPSKWKTSIPVFWMWNVCHIYVTSSDAKLELLEMSESCEGFQILVLSVFCIK